MACHNSNNGRKRFHRKARATPIEEEFDNDTEQWYWRVDGLRDSSVDVVDSPQKVAVVFSGGHDGGGSLSCFLLIYLFFLVSTAIMIVGMSSGRSRVTQIQSINTLVWMDV